ncbi:hypothetical protein OZN62_12285 [Aurantiacibacter sp. MUD11]|uniref:hypothetical protein n=1 Tax=Aurantiacibacter sp. MUD11 TaxID=3003265 RepID=UPI0022AA5962|nr:hypothetical protein [Aurantiacibacter sp. MUD11]WAT17679.1 hypothetical protein OZN62_12285 [Aurantiacibacter sp. MUD11]
MFSRLTLAAVFLWQAAPAAAAGATQIPEGSQLTLFALGALGVIIGRRLSMRGADKDGGQD